MGENIKIVKRNGELEDFKTEKIYNALKKAYYSVYLEDSDELFEENGIQYIFEMIVDAIEEDVQQIMSAREEDDLEEEYSEEDNLLTVEDIQDMVEEYLMDIDSKRDLGLIPVVKEYIIYRDIRNKTREKSWDMTELQRDIYEKKYRYEKETFEEFLDRVSGGDYAIKTAIREKKFMPAGRILAGRGLDRLGKKITLSNCYVLPKTMDNIESIFDTAKYLAKTYSYGGGVGLNISNLRPRGAKVNNAASTTTGAVSFMDLYSLVTGLIGMRGRRGALMLNIDCSHPDLEEFIEVKNDLEKVTSANISVNVTNDFMEAVEKNEKYVQSFHVESTGEVIEKEVDARELFRKLAFNNWNMAEPGVLYWDKINSWHLMSEDKDFEYAGVNPCAEEPLPAFGSCNLASINLGEFVKEPFTDEADFDFEGFKSLVKSGVIYLNEVLDENMKLHPLQQQKDVANNLRQIGLGIMGLADTFIKLGVEYGSMESLNIIDKIGKVLVDSALEQSALLAKEYGPFPYYKADRVLESPFLLQNASEETINLIKEHGLRNSQVLTIAPTGSISTLIGASNGIEPLFQISYTRKTESLHAEDKYYKVYAEIVKELMKNLDIEDEEDLPKFIVTADKLNYRKRIDVQSTFQKYIDASISSTVNVPNEFTVDEVEDLYIYAWEKGLKGITIYRDGCSRLGILTTEKTKNNKIQELQDEINREVLRQLEEDPDKCPMCGGKLNKSGGCSECQDCGYSPCAI